MTHFCQILPFRRPAPRQPNVTALLPLQQAEDLVVAIDTELHAAIGNASAGTRTAGLGGVTNGRTLSWALRLALAFIALRNAQADAPLKSAIDEWLHQRGEHG